MSNLFITSLLPAIEYKPKQTDLAAQVLWIVLRPGRWQEYPYCRDEQSSSSDNSHAHEI